MPTLGEPGTPAPYEEPRDISIGEARYRLAAMLIAVLQGWPIKMRLYPQERRALAVLCGAFIRRWPWLKRYEKS